MNDTPAGAQSAGALLRAAREAQGLHIAALAAAIKVAPAKLDALEGGRYAELPDATFTRALAQSVCRVLKIDARPVLGMLPAAVGVELEKVDGGLNTPFRDRPGRIDPIEWAVWRQPAFWGVLVLLAAAAAFMLLPPLQLPSLPDLPSLPALSSAPGADATATATPAEGASAPAAASAAVETVFAAPPAETPASGAVATPANLVGLRATEPSWVEVQDRNGQVLLQRTLQPGESVGVDGALPMRVKIGNVAATQLSFRGQAVDLAAASRDNVARLELK